MRIVCIGPGLAALEAAPLIKRWLPSASVTVVTPDVEHTLAADASSLLGGVTRYQDVVVNLEQPFKAQGIELIAGTPLRIDREHRTVHLQHTHVVYDYLVLDLPAEPDTGELHGPVLQAESAKDALHVRQHVVSQLLKARSTNAPEHFSFVVVGASIHGFETAANLANLLSHASQQHLIFPSELAVVLVSHEHHELPAPARRKLLRALEDAGVEYYDERLQALGEGAKLRDKTIETETVIWAGNTRPHAVLASLGLHHDTKGKLHVNEFLQSSDEKIFAAGPSTTAAITGAPQSCRVYVPDAAVLARNVVNHATGKRMRRHAPRQTPPLLVTTGENTALLATNWLLWNGTVPAKLKRMVNRSRTRRLTRKA